MNTISMSHKNKINFNTNKKILYLLPTPSMKGGMTAITQMWYDVGLFESGKTKHFDTNFFWGRNVFVRLIESFVLKIKFIYVLLQFKPYAIYVISSPYWGFYDKICYCAIARVFSVKSIFNNVSARFIKFHESTLFNRTLSKWCIKIPDALVVGSPYWYNYFNEHFPHANVVEIPNPVNANEYIHNNKEQANTNRIKVVTASRITIDKGIQELIQVIKIVCSQSDQFEFIIMGVGPELENTRRELATYVSSGNVQIKGFVIGDEKIKTITNSNIYLLLTHFDMMPISILEAMSAGLPVFTTKVGGVDDMIQDNENGHLFSVKEVNQVAEKLLSYVNKREKLIEMGVKGRKKVLEKYDIEVIANQHIHLVNSI